MDSESWSTCKKILKLCSQCKLSKGVKYHVPESPPYPDVRDPNIVPFSICSLDMSGHFYVKEGQTVLKCYLYLFLCLSSRAVHLEVAPDATSKSFANVYTRFISRKGTPSMIISDHGSNFRGFSKELAVISKSPSVSKLLLADGVEWKFIPIQSPFMGGHFERNLGTVKSVIKKAMGKRVLSRDQFDTLIAYTECIVNDRPISYICSNDENQAPLTPNLLLFGRNLHRNFQSTVGDIDLNDPTYAFGNKGNLNTMCAKLRSTLSQVKKNWSADYLSFLKERDRNRTKNSPANKHLLKAAAGDVVIVATNNKELKLGRIVRLISSADGEVRAAEVRIGGKLAVHSLVNLRHFESVDLRPEDESHSRSPLPAQDRPRRKAALKAQQQWL